MVIEDSQMNIKASTPLFPRSLDYGNKRCDLHPPGLSGLPGPSVLLRHYRPFQPPWNPPDAAFTSRSGGLRTPDLFHASEFSLHFRRVLC